MRFLFIAILFFCLISFKSISQNVEISGFAPEYSNDTLIFFTTDDYITNTKIQLVQTIVNDTGYFNCKFNIEKTCLSELYLGIYKGLLFFEPGKSYHIKLPKKKEKEIADNINPYFKELQIYLGIYNSDKDELNFLVKKFDYFYDHYIEDNYFLIYRQGYHSEIDTFIVKLSNYFKFANNKYFADYMKYKFANLRMLANEREIKFVTRKYYLDKKFLYNNIAYMDMFNQLYQNYFSYYSQTEEGKKIFSDIAKAKSIYHIKKTLDYNLSLTNDTLKELVILKGLNDAFKPKNTANFISFPKPQLLQTLDSMIILTKIAEHKHIAENIKKKVTAKYLKSGDIAPAFELYNKNKELVSLHSLKGKYIYLCFYSSWNISCLQDIGLLNNIYKKHKDKLEIVTIFCDGNIQDMIDIIDENKYKWTILHLKNQKEILKEYNVNIYPTYFLIDPYSKIIILPAPSPNENFEKIFFKVLMSRN